MCVEEHHNISSTMMELDISSTNTSPIEATNSAQLFTPGVKVIPGIICGYFG
jgi:hypothetical protein